MPVPALPADPSDGQVAPASWGDAVRDLLNFHNNVPACRLYRATDQTITNNDATQWISFSNERYDTDNMWAAGSPTIITINTAGLYLFTCRVFFVVNGTGIRELVLNHSVDGNIDYDTQPAPSATQGMMLSVATVWKCAAATTVRVRAFQNSGAGLNIARFANWSQEFTATWLGNG